MNKSDSIRKLLAKGITVKEIAKRLRVAPNNVYQVRWQDRQDSKAKKKKVKAKKESKPERSADPKVQKAEKKYVKKVTAAFKSKKPSKIVKAARITKAELAALLPKPDLVNKPPHYTTGGVDFLDYAEAKGLIENAYLFNVVKYVSRAGKKIDADPVQDLQKAEFYLKREIERRKGA